MKANRADGESSECEVRAGVCETTEPRGSTRPIAAAASSQTEKEKPQAVSRKGCPGHQ